MAGRNEHPPSWERYREMERFIISAEVSRADTDEISLLIHYSLSLETNYLSPGRLALYTYIFLNKWHAQLLNVNLLI